MNRRKVFILLFILLILVMFYILFLWVDQKVNEVQDQHRKFIYCSLINQGMTRDEVNEQLSLIGEFTEENHKGFPENLDLSSIHFVDKKLRFITGGDTIITY